MLDDQKHADDICLNEIQSLSKQISDLINCGNYDQVKDLDNTRLDLIKNFKDKNNKNYQNIIYKISEKNKDDIDQIESKLYSLKEEKSKFIKRFKAYNN